MLLSQRNICSGIEVVITSTTGNRVVVKSGTRVQIPPTAPKETNKSKKLVCLFFIPRIIKYYVFWSDFNRKLNETLFSNIFIEKRVFSCPQSLEESGLFSFALLTSEGENSQNAKRIFLRKVVI